MGDELRTREALVITNVAACMSASDHLEAPLKYSVSSQNVLDKIQPLKVKDPRKLLTKVAYFQGWTWLIVIF